MGIHYVRPPTNVDGSRMSYEQRKAARKAQANPLAPPIVIQRPDQTYEQRKSSRKAEEQGRQEAVVIADAQEAARKAAELANTPEHLRRPRNVWRDLIDQWQGQAYRPEIAKKLDNYRLRAEKEDSRIDADMAERARRHAVETNPETIKAREHLATVSQGADDAERLELARLRGLIEAGGAADYWAQVQPLTQARLARLQERVAAETANRAEHDAEWEALQAELKAAEGLGE